MRIRAPFRLQGRFSRHHWLARYFDQVSIAFEMAGNAFLASADFQ